MVDVGIVLTENILKPRQAGPVEARAARGRATAAPARWAGAALTAVLTTVVSFLPVFTMEGAEGKLFKPLAYTKTFALIAFDRRGAGRHPPLAHLLGCAARPVRRGVERVVPHALRAVVDVRLVSLVVARARRGAPGGCRGSRSGPNADPRRTSCSPLGMIGCRAAAVPGRDPALATSRSCAWCLQPQGRVPVPADRARGASAWSCGSASRGSAIRSRVVAAVARSCPPSRTCGGRAREGLAAGPRRRSPASARSSCRVWTRARSS